MISATETFVKCVSIVISVIATMVHKAMVLSVVFNVVIYHVTMVISEAVILNLSVTMVTMFYFCKNDESLLDYGAYKLLN